jgi:hypothetical protein
VAVIALSPLVVIAHEPLAALPEVKPIFEAMVTARDFLRHLPDRHLDDRSVVQFML